jgi:threonine synthase
MVTFNRPEKLNALKVTLVAELAQLAERTAREAEIRCLVLTGSERAFSVGADIADQQQYGERVVFGAERLNAWEEIQNFPKPLDRFLRLSADVGDAVPDNIVVPVGGGSSLLGCWRAFCELKQRGEVDRLPRLFGVQAANCAPLHQAFSAGHETAQTVAILPTIAEGIAIAAPIRAREILYAMNMSGGGSVAVSEEEIVLALKGLSRRGFFVEPTSATAAAGLTRLIANRIIGENQATIVVLTGSGLKAIDKIGKLLGHQ